MPKTMPLDEIPKDLFYASAPIRASRVNIDYRCVHRSSNAAVTKGLSKAIYNLETQQPTTTIFAYSKDAVVSQLDDFKLEISGGFIDEYDFETSRNLHDDATDEDQQAKVTSSFVDDHDDDFYGDKKVMPLKPPPGVHCFHDNNSGNGSQSPGTTPSPRTPTSALRHLFARQSLWNDDYDPFMAALETVKQGEKNEKSKKSKHRRAQSNGKVVDESKRLDPLNKDAARSWSFRSPNGEMGQQESPGSSMRLGKPKGVAFARHVRLVRMDHEKAEKSPTGPASLFHKHVGYSASFRKVTDEMGPQEDVEQAHLSPIRLVESIRDSFSRSGRLVKADHEKGRKPTSPVPKPIENVGENAKTSPGNSHEGKRQRIKKFIKSLSMGKIDGEKHKQTGQKVENSKHKLIGPLSLKQMGPVQGNGLAEARKMALAHHGQRLLPCIGVGHRFAKR